MQQAGPVSASARRVLVTGATGRSGRLIVEALRRGGWTVRALLRASSRVPLEWEDVERAVGDLGDEASVVEALDGVFALVLLSPMDPDLDVLEAGALRAARRVRVGHVVKISTTVPDVESPISWWRAHARAEIALRESGLSWTVIRPNGIAFFLLDYAETVRTEGVMHTCAPDGRMALIDPRDIADVVAAVLEVPSRYAGATLSLTGPQALSYDDVAVLLSGLLQLPVRHVAVAESEIRDGLLAAGRPSWEVEGVVANMRMTRGDAYGFDRVTRTVREVTGHEPRRVEDFLRLHLDAFGGVAPTPSRPSASPRPGEAQLDG